MLEGDIEDVFLLEAKKAGAFTAKVPPPPAGVPDRIICWPDGTYNWVELKTTVGNLSAIQKARHGEILRKTGQAVVTVSGPAEVREWIRSRSAEIAMNERRTR